MFPGRQEIISVQPDPWREPDDHYRVRLFKQANVFFREREKAYGIPPLPDKTFAGVKCKYTSFWYLQWRKFPGWCHNWKAPPEIQEGAKVNIAAHLYNEEHDITWVYNSKGGETDPENDEDLSDIEPIDRELLQHHPTWKPTHWFEYISCAIDFLDRSGGKLFFYLAGQDEPLCAIHRQFFHACPREKAEMSLNVPFRHIVGRVKKLIPVRTVLEEKIMAYRRFGQTTRQTKILDYLMRGKTIAEIACLENVSEKTIDREIKRMDNQEELESKNSNTRIAELEKELTEEKSRKAASDFKLRILRGLDQPGKMDEITGMILGHYTDTPTAEDKAELAAEIKKQLHEL